MSNLIKFDEQNYRLHSDRNKRIIKKSLQDLGAGRSIVVDKENFIIAGNGVFEAAQQLKLKTRIIESDGTELIVVKRTDISTDDEKRKLLALVDNHASDTSEFDFDLLMSDFAVEDLDVWEFDTQGENDPKKEFDELGDFDFNNSNVQSWKSLVVHFDNETDFEKFRKLLNLKITDKTKATYFPQKEKEKAPEIYE
jgi:hypothetical protein